MQFTVSRRVFTNTSAYTASCLMSYFPGKKVVAAGYLFRNCVVLKTILPHPRYF